MDKIQVDYNELEKVVDDWIPNLLNKEIPRYSFIFHCNCAYVDAAIETGCFFQFVRIFRKVFSICVKLLNAFGV